MPNLNKIAKKWQKKWEEKGAFNAEPKKNRKKIFFTTPYPYISGSLHIGHGRAVTESDVLCRYLRMSGHNVLYPMAFHITGTPVLGISAAIKNKDKKKIKLYEDYVSAYEKDKKKIKKTVESFEDPQKLVDFFIPKMIKEYGQLGTSVDWRRSFTSGDVEHQKMVSWQFEKYNELGYLTKGKYPVLYSPQDESAMGEDDIQDADVDSVEKQEFTIIKFKFNDKYLVAATLRPETMYGQTNLWINPDIKYIEAKIGKETWILSKEALEKLKYQFSNIEVFGPTKEKLVGEFCRAPLIERDIMILPSSFVDSDVGTGIVTSVPSDAPYDYIALKEIKSDKEKQKRHGIDKQKLNAIEIIPIINTKKYGEESAQKVIEENQIKNQDDKRLNKLTQDVYKEGFHTGILLKTCGSYSGMNVTEAKEKIKQQLLLKNKAAIMYDTSRKAVSRSGGKIIVAILEDQWFIDFNAKGWKEKAKKCLEKIDIYPTRMRKQFEDTFDWLDKRPCARKRGLGTLLPVDKNWIVESLSDSTIYMTLYTIKHLIKKHKIKGEQLNNQFFDYVYLGKGIVEKVSKETKIQKKVLQEMRESYEYWMPVDQRHTFTLHLSNHLSFMIFAHAGLFPEKYWPKSISFHGLIVNEGTKMGKSKGNVITLLEINEKYGADVYRFYSTSSTNIEGTFDWRDEKAENSKLTINKLYNEVAEAIKRRKSGKSVGKLYRHKFNKIIKNATEKIKEMNLREYNQEVIYNMLKIVKDAKFELSKDELAPFYKMITEDWIKLISPVCPHLAEELWEKSGRKSLVSLEDWPKYNNKKIDENIEKEETAKDQIISDILNVINIIKEKNGKEIKKVYIYVIPKEKDIYNPKRIQKSINKEIIIYTLNDKDKYDPENKSKKAKPGKPAIFLE
tara:strand:- start:172 stop:2871 length:2700 start_codon:yes stop_codon:yes gene_type:complete